MSINDQPAIERSASRLPFLVRLHTGRAAPRRERPLLAVDDHHLDDRLLSDIGVAWWEVRADTARRLRR